MIIQSISIFTTELINSDRLDNHAHVNFLAQWLVSSGSTGGKGSRSGQKLKMRNLNTQDVIQIHPAHNFVNFGPFRVYVVPNERPTLSLSFSVFYVWKYEVLHPVKIEE